MRWKSHKKERAHDAPEAAVTNTDSIIAALAEGIVRGKEDLRKAQEQREAYDRQNKTELAASFNTAAGVIEGLTALKELPGSKLAFHAGEQISRVYISVGKKSGPDAGGSYDDIDRGPRLSIIAKTGGELSAYFYQSDRDSEGESVSGNAQQGGTEKVLSFVAERAVKMGLIP